MNRLLRIFRTSIGCKALMAVTGLLLLGFVLTHLLGNLQIYGGRQLLNDYAARLQALGPLLWVARLALLGVFVVHMAAAFRLASLNRAARPERYVVEDTRRASVASRTMLLSGLLILGFVLFHLAHFTLGFVQYDAYRLRDPLDRHDVHGMVLQGFRNPAITLFYVASMLVLGLHVWHGGPSLLQSLGLRHEAWKVSLNRAMQMLIVLIVIGNCAIPLSILFGLYRGAP